MTLYGLADRSALPDKPLPRDVFAENRAVIESLELPQYANTLVGGSILYPQVKLVIDANAPNLEPWPALELTENRSANR